MSDISENPVEAFTEDLIHWPVLHSPTEEPDRHWKTEDRETVNEIVEARRRAEGRLPIDKKTAPPLLSGLDENGENSPVNKLRAELRKWRKMDYAGATPPTARFLRHLASGAERENEFAPHFAQREAVETVAYLTEVCKADHFMIGHLKKTSGLHNRGLMRLALRMATGTGKTVVMACLIAFFAINRGRGRNSRKGLAKNVDRVVVVCPGKTILASLKGKLAPNDRGNIYDAFGLLPDDLRCRLNGFRVNVVNYESLKPRENADLAGLEVGKAGGWKTPGQKVLNRVMGKEPEEGRETFERMWSRILRIKDRKKRRIVILNDEGHHCRAQNGDHDGVWMTALQELRNHPSVDLAQVIDLSATPMFINPKNDLEAPRGKDANPLFPWIVSECGLAEAMESGLVKIPRLPEKRQSDGVIDLRNLYESNDGKALKNPGAMKPFRDAARILYADYERTFENWMLQNDVSVGEPVLIVVANNKSNAEAIFHMIGGSRNDDGSLSDSDGFPLLSNVKRGEGDELVEGSPRTIRVVSKSVSEKAEGGGSLDAVQRESLIGLPGPGAKKPSAEYVQEVLQTVAQPGKPGDGVRCVVSVGMLTEGWDCQRVTHILGYRAFGSQLLCEQVLGRSLRRADHDTRVEIPRKDNGQVTQRYRPEYAAVVGVPFETMPAPEEEKHAPPAPTHEVHPSGKKERRIDVPVFTGYRLEIRQGRLTLDMSEVKEPRAVRAATDISGTKLAGAFGTEQTAERGTAECSGDWLLASEIVQQWLDRYKARQNDTLKHRTEKIWGGQEEDAPLRATEVFADTLGLIRDWLSKRPGRKDCLRDADVRGAVRDALVPGLRIGGHEPVKTGVPKDSFTPTASASDWPLFKSRLSKIYTPEKSELNKAVCHSDLEIEIVEELDAWEDVTAITRNHGPNRFEIPYRYQGSDRSYVPDFFVKLDRKIEDGRTVHVVVEGKGEPDDLSEAKLSYTRNWWLPAANEAGKRLDAPQVWIHVEVGPRESAKEAILRELETLQFGATHRHRENPYRKPPG